MLKITLKIDGMMCGMCEAHVNDEIRQSFTIKKVSSSHARGETVIITESDIPDGSLEAAIEKTGYSVVSIDREPYEKKNLFDRFRKKR
ncbi:MAG: heavy-metal-associated domain-containing protein [Porcipelethomonas sp.]